MTKNTSPLTPAELATNSPELIERLRGDRPNKTSQVLYRFHIGLVTADGLAIDGARRADARGLIDAAYPDGYTLTETQGRYNGTDEPSWIVEVYAESKAQERAVWLAVDLRKLLSQECIGLAILPVTQFSLI